MPHPLEIEISSSRDFIDRNLNALRPDIDKKDQLAS